MARHGKVYLVGSGPGDPGLITVRARELIAEADAILHDRLIPQGVLTDARPDALIVDSGKEHSGDSGKQAQIDQRLIKLAKQGLSIVRLKGGDPLVFGRGAEEAAALAAEGIEFEIVPGVTSGVAAPAYAGIPVTHREHASAVAFITGHEDPTRPAEALDWQALAAFPGTLAFYMGVKHLPQISERLITLGKSPETPVAVIERGTTAHQRTVCGTLADIAELAQAATIRPPAMTVVGDVVGERERIAWFEHRPLLGRSVVVTRARAQASELSARLRKLGADVVEAPAISTRRRSDPEITVAIDSLEAYDLIAFTSVVGVDSFFDVLKDAGKDARALAGLSVAAIGGATSTSLQGHGIAADCIPERQTAEGLLEALSDVQGKRVLLAQAAQGRKVLAEGLTLAGADVTKLSLYDTIAEELSPEQLADVARAEFVTFASGSSVRSFVSALGGPQAVATKKLVSIGPSTSTALGEFGLSPTREAGQHDIDGLIGALLEIA